MKIVLQNFHKNRTKIIMNCSDIEKKFLKSKYVKNEWNYLDLRTRIIYFITKELKLYCNETLNDKSLNYLESELYHKLYHKGVT